MKIVVNDIAASSGGALSVLIDFYTYIKENDSENEWIFLLNNYHFEETNNIKIKILKDVKNSKIKKLIFDFITGKNYIKKLKPDVIFSLQNIITFGIKIPQIVYIHQSIPFQNIKTFSFFKKNEFNIAVYQHIIGKIIIASAKKADKVIVQTKWMKESVNNKIKNGKKIVNILPNVIIQNIKNKNDFEYNNFFYPTSDFIYKNNDCIYEACKILNENNLNYSMKITLDNTTNIKNVDFIGKITRDEVINEYAVSTLVFPSYIETFGYPLAEARKIGTIILASDCPFSHELLDGYDNAYFFNPFNYNELADLMQKVINKQIVKKDINEKNTTLNINSWSKVKDEILNSKK